MLFFSPFNYNHKNSLLISSVCFVVTCHSVRCTASGYLELLISNEQCEEFITIKNMLGSSEMISGYL